MSAFIDYYKNLIILQYAQLPKATAEIDLVTSEFERIYNFVKSFETEFDLDYASGHRLDLIGKIVGIDRIVEEGYVKKYFGFADNPNAFTFGQAPLFDKFKDVGYSRTELDDNQFRFFIRAKITKNIVHAVMTSDEVVSLQDAIQFLFDYKAYVLDNKDMTLTLYVDASFNFDDIRILQSEDLIPSPQGVGYKVIIKYHNDGTFGFSDNPNSKTFGQGKFAEKVL